MAGSMDVLWSPQDSENEEDATAADVPSPSHHLLGLSPSLWIVVILNFLGFFGFSCILPSLWGYIHSLGGSKVFFGLVVTSYSVGQLAGNPLLELWYTRRGAREVYLASLSLCLGGNILYAFAESKYSLLVARTVIGFSSGNGSVGSAYAAHNTNDYERARVFSYMTVAQVLGFIVGPATASGLSLLHLDLPGGIRVDQYTAPGFFYALLVSVSIVMVTTMVEDHPLAADEPGVEAKSATESEEGDAVEATAVETKVPGETVSSPVRMGTIILFLFLNFTNTIVFTVVETLIPPLTHDNYGWHSFSNGLLYAAMGVMAVISAVLVIFLERRVADVRLLLLGSQCVVACALFEIIEFNRYWKGHVVLSRLLVGCLLGAVGYPMSGILLVTMFSRVLMSQKGMYIGLFNSGGSLARVIGPLWGTTAYLVGGSGLIFSLCTGTQVLTLATSWIFYNRLLPVSSTMTRTTAESSSQAPPDELPNTN